MKFLTRGKSDFLRIVAARIVPESTELDTAGSDRFFAIVDAALGDRDPSVRRQFGTFLALLKWAPMLRFGSPFDKLPAERQDAVLRWFEDCPVALLRSGTWGLKTMVFMGYYGQPETNDLVGYHPGGLHA